MNFIGKVLCMLAAGALVLAGCFMYLIAFILQNPIGSIITALLAILIWKLL